MYVHIEKPGEQGCVDLKYIVIHYLLMLNV